MCGEEPAARSQTARAGEHRSPRWHREVRGSGGALERRAAQRAGARAALVDHHEPVAARADAEPLAYPRHERHARLPGPAAQEHDHPARRVGGAGHGHPQPQPAGRLAGVVERHRQRRAAHVRQPVAGTRLTQPSRRHSGGARGGVVRWPPPQPAASAVSARAGSARLTASPPSVVSRKFVLSFPSGWARSDDARGMSRCQSIGDSRRVASGAPGRREGAPEITTHDTRTPQPRAAPLPAPGGGTRSPAPGGAAGPRAAPVMTIEAISP